MTSTHHPPVAAVLACAALLAVTGCSATGGADRTAIGSAEPVWASAHCGVWHEGVRLIDAPADLEAVLARARRSQVGGSGPSPRSVDFAGRVAVRVALGRKATAGYAVGPSDDPVVVVGRSARLTVAIDEPPPDSMQAQVVTDPCAVLSIPRGDYASVVVQDTQGSVLGRVALE